MQCIVQCHARAQHHEQRHVTFFAQIFQIHHHAVQHFRQGLDSAVQLAGAHAQTVAVDGGVAAPVNDGAAFRCDLQPIAVSPHRARISGQVAAAGLSAKAWREGVEITAYVTLVVGVAPEKRRHARQRLRHHQLTHLICHRLALFVPSLDTHTQKTALHFTGCHGQFAVTADIRTGIGAARNIAPPNVRALLTGLGIHLFELVSAPLLHLGAQRRAGGAQCPHGVQSLDACQLHIGLHAVGKKRRAAAKKCHAFAGRITPQHTPIGLVFGAAWVAVVNHASGTAQ